jgi:hypothetical protein
VHLSSESIIENVIFSNIVIETRLFDRDWWGCAEPIFVMVLPWTDDYTIGSTRHLRFSNILCRGENGVVVYGGTQDCIQDVLFDNVRVELDKSSKWEGGMLDLRPCSGDSLPKHSNSGFLLKNAQGVTIRNCEVTWGETRPDYFHHAIEAINVARLKIENFQGEAAHPDSYAAIWQH